MTEFASALTIFIFCLLIPLLNFAAVPIRYVIAFGLVADLTRKLSLAEKRSQAIRIANESSAYQELANWLGIQMSVSRVSIICQNKNAESLVLSDNKPVPKFWLPGGSMGQSVYLLQTSTEVELAPLVCFGPKISMLTAPVRMTLTAESPWENLGWDPATQESYLNE